MNCKHCCSFQVKAVCLQKTDCTLFTASSGKFHTKFTILKARLAAVSKSDDRQQLLLKTEQATTDVNLEESYVGPQPACHQQTLCNLPSQQVRRNPALTYTCYCFSGSLPHPFPVSSSYLNADLWGESCCYSTRTKCSYQPSETPVAD